jgi:hypothetical protein
VRGARGCGVERERARLASGPAVSVGGARRGLVWIRAWDGVSWAAVAFSGPAREDKGREEEGRLGWDSGRRERLGQREAKRAVLSEAGRGGAGPVACGP